MFGLPLSHVLGMCWLQQAACWPTGLCGLTLPSLFEALTAETGSRRTRSLVSDQNLRGSVSSPTCLLESTAMPEAL